MRTLRLLLVGIIPVIFAACATTKSATVPGRTLASPKLQMEAVETIAIRESMSGSQCRTPKVLGTEVVGVTSDPRFEGERLVAGSWKERWTVDVCGKVVRYRLEFGTNKIGGIVINLSPPEEAK